jgi:hypothetical protein
MASYYFLKLARIKGDTIVAYQNNYLYYHAVSEFENKDDFFNTGEEFILTKKDIQQMLDDDEINAVYRNYGDSKGFNHMN